MALIQHFQIKPWCILPVDFEAPIELRGSALDKWWRAALQHALAEAERPTWVKRRDV
jgi:hypothetical protein